MLFYVIGGPKGERPPPAAPPKEFMELAAPPKEFMELVVKEWQHVIGLKEQGKVVAAYAYIEKPGGFVVFDVESREALDELLMTLPLYEHANFQVTPLITAEQALERAKKGKTYGPAPT